MRGPGKFPEVLTVRLPAGMTHRIGAVLTYGETEASFVRDLIVKWVIRREMAIAAEDQCQYEEAVIK